MTNGPAFGTGSIWYKRSVNLDREFCSNCGVRLEPEPEIARFLL